MKEKEKKRKRQKRDGGTKRGKGKEGVIEEKRRGERERELHVARVSQRANIKHRHIGTIIFRPLFINNMKIVKEKETKRRATENLLQIGFQALWDLN